MFTQFLISVSKLIEGMKRYLAKISVRIGLTSFFGSALVLFSSISRFIFGVNLEHVFRGPLVIACIFSIATFILAFILDKNFNLRKGIFYMIPAFFGSILFYLVFFLLFSLSFNPGF